MTGLKAIELAQVMNLSRGRISQMVKGGILEGCFAGSGRQRRFDLEKCLAAYKGLDPGQRLGNGAKTQKAIEELDPAKRAPANARSLPDSPAGAASAHLPEAASAPPAPPPLDGGQKAGTDEDDGYHLARTRKAVEEARKLERLNAEAEGAYVLASEVELQTRKLLRQEITEMETVLRDGARKVADEFGVDFKGVRKLLMDQWRGHRSRRSSTLAEQALETEMSNVEQGANI